MLKFRRGKHERSIITDGQTVCVDPEDIEWITEAYGGRLVCEGVDPEFFSLLEHAPDLYRVAKEYVRILEILRYVGFLPTPIDFEVTKQEAEEILAKIGTIDA